jgi:hypothetical protein
MAEASISIPHLPTIGDLAVVTIARQVSRDRVRDQIRRRGDKVSEYGAKDISDLADRYLRDNREAVMRDVVAKLWPRPKVDVD